MNVLDIALVVGALGIAALTFTQPPITVIADIVALYAASVLAGLLYVPASKLPMLQLLPDNDTVTVRLAVFVALLVGGALVLRGLLRRVAGMMAVSRWAAGPLLGNLLSAALSVLLALGVVLVTVVALVAIAQMPTAVGVVTFVRDQLGNSHLIPRLAEPMKVYLRLIGLFFPSGIPAVYADIGMAATHLAVSPIPSVHYAWQAQRLPLLCDISFRHTPLSIAVGTPKDDAAGDGEGPGVRNACPSRPAFWKRSNIRKVLARLARVCDYSLARERAEALQPETAVPPVRRLLTETTEARALLASIPEIGVGGARDVRAPVRLAALGVTLNPAQLLDIKDTAAASRSLRRTLVRLPEGSERFPVILDHAAALATSRTSMRRSRRQSPRAATSSIAPRTNYAASASASAPRRAACMEYMNGFIRGPRAAALQEPIVTERDGRLVVPVRADRATRCRASSTIPPRAGRRSSSSRWKRSR